MIAMEVPVKSHPELLLPSGWHSFPSNQYDEPLPQIAAKSLTKIIINNLHVSSCCCRIVAAACSRANQNAPHRVPTSPWIGPSRVSKSWRSPGRPGSRSCIWSIPGVGMKRSVVEGRASNVNGKVELPMAALLIASLGLSRGFGSVWCIHGKGTITLRCQTPTRLFVGGKMWPPQFDCFQPFQDVQQLSVTTDSWSRVAGVQSQFWGCPSDWIAGSAAGRVLRQY